VHQRSADPENCTGRTRWTLEFPDGCVEVRLRSSPEVPMSALSQVNTLHNAESHLGQLAVGCLWTSWVAATEIRNWPPRSPTYIGLGRISRRIRTWLSLAFKPRSNGWLIAGFLSESEQKRPLNEGVFVSGAQ